MKSKPELLAPAGTLECAITAYECGADAVYAGLQRFNARARGKNFSFEDMSKLSAYAKKHGKKFYVTMNTVIKESEIADVARDLAELSKLDPDAVIVQDIGVARLVREFMPNIPLHASTQMGIHNSHGIEQARSMGVERVILEREVTLDELQLILDKNPLEIEIFIHGALCSSLSGNCIWSSWIGGWSGNRGSCKQVCRRRFHCDGDSKEKKSGFFFSTNDMYALDLIPKLIRMGIASFKIEGRMKNPDYIKNVVTAYRMMIDVENDSDIGKTLGEAKKVLSESLGRKWSHGFLTKGDMDTLIKYDTLSVSGQLSGNVVESNPAGFAVELTRTLKKGDRIRIQPRDGEGTASVTITQMSVNKKPTKLARKGERVFILCDRNVPKDGLVYKVGAALPNRTAYLETLPVYQKKIEVDLDVRVFPNGIAVKILSHPDKPTWNSSFNIEPAQKRALDNDALVKGFSQTDSTIYELGTLKSYIKGQLFLPAGTLKRERRAFWIWASEQLENVQEEKQAASKLDEFLFEYAHSEPSDASQEKESVMITLNSDSPKKQNIFIVKSIFEFDRETDEVSLPHFCSEERIEELSTRIQDAYDMGIRRFRVTSLYQINMLKKYNDIVKVTGYPFPILNSVATRELYDYGFSRVQASLELDKDQFHKFINRSQLPVELYRYGRPFLYATRAKVHVEGHIADNRGIEFTVENDRNMGINYVYPIEVLSIPEMENTVAHYDLSHAQWDERETTEFNLQHELK